jgi:uncharacterized membrane protein YfcA
MNAELIAIVGVIGLLSIVQSIFGLGILVFGTPTLLLMGYPFTEALSYLLPASFAISLLQVLTAGNDRGPVSPFLYTLCLPAIVVGLWLVETFETSNGAHYLVGTMLLVSAFLRLSPAAQRRMTALLAKSGAAFHLVMGLVHGLTNLGGAILTILAGATRTEKRAVRNLIAHYYLMFSIVQILVLIVISGLGREILFNAFTAGISATTYLLVGNRLFQRVNNPAFQIAFTLFMAAYGGIILLRA